ncbi:putative transcriptional regulatory protein [Candidatus Izimaplasma bacterium HR1]|jgi:YebC/PmpR family DNA-binding regulatory protein|uniref:YebC/PmpR family DNA-binding transcriptional regulator n=1 Tax=Candidatus Izimoplasma sp. HR1 TaxID=1541959 RepID=UPI0004F7A04C|nr:putative transcriptional regulatory protein [Candidatus Izimaplasma bacterium HR1]
MGRKFEVRKAAMAKTMLKKSRLYSRYGKEIYMSAKQGGSNPDANLALKHLIDKAKKDQVPTDVIKRNVQKAEKGIGEDYTPIRYEGFGPNGVSFIVDTLTDNVNRTVSEVKNCFTKSNGNLGVSGCVEHGYKHLSYINVKGLDEEEVLETLLMADLDVLDLSEEEGVVEVEADGYELTKIQSTLEEAGAEIVDTEQGWYPIDSIKIDEETRKQFDKFMDMVNEVEDVQEVYHNVDLEVE